MMMWRRNICSNYCTSFSFGLLFGKDSTQTKQKQSSLSESPLFVAFVALSFFFCAFFLIVFLTTEGIPFLVSLAIWKNWFLNHFRSYLLLLESLVCLVCQSFLLFSTFSSLFIIFPGSYLCDYYNLRENTPESIACDQNVASPDSQQNVSHLSPASSPASSVSRR